MQRALSILSVIVSIGILGYVGTVMSSAVMNRTARQQPAPAKVVARKSSDRKQREAVPTNRSVEVPDGFRGEVHPMLKGQTKVEVAGRWTTVGKGGDRIHEVIPSEVYRLFLDLKLARERQTYTPRELSAFMPAEVGQVGQIWTLDVEKVRELLKQFHPRPSMSLQAKGRRAGPDGAFGLLRAVTPQYLDIVFRIHAEFDLMPQEWNSPIPLDGIWYTPAYLAGRMLVDRQAGTVAFFEMALPSEKTLNVHLTVAHPRGDNHDIVRVDHMELVGGDKGLADEIDWNEAVAVSEAHSRLAEQFYKFMEIEWVPVEQALAVARAQDKPIMAMVLWGALDDQSC